MKQAALALNLSVKKTRKREFLEQMERVVPWDAQATHGGAGMSATADRASALQRAKKAQACRKTNAISGADA